MNNVNNTKIGVGLDQEIPYSIIENYIFDIKELSANKKILLLVLRRYAGYKMEPAFPSLLRLAKECGIGKDTVIKGIKFFEWLKFIEKIKRPKSNRDNDTNFYIVKTINITKILEHFKKDGVDIDTVEKHFDKEYKDKDTRKKLLDSDCPFLSAINRFSMVFLPVIMLMKRIQQVIECID